MEVVKIYFLKVVDDRGVGLGVFRVYVYFVVFENNKCEGFVKLFTCKKDIYGI